jgi:DNA-binding transcriptional MerR regulator
MRKSLLAQSSRKSAGYRLYEEDDIALLRFIRKAKRLGFMLMKVKELLAMRSDPLRACPDVQRQAEVKIEDIQARVQALEEARNGVYAACQEQEVSWKPSTSGRMSDAYDRICGTDRRVRRQAVRARRFDTRIRGYKLWRGR